MTCSTKCSKKCFSKFQDDAVKNRMFESYILIVLKIRKNGIRLFYEW